MASQSELLFQAGTLGGLRAAGGALLCIINELHNQEVNPKTQQNNKTRKLLLLEKIELWPHSHHCFVLILSQLLLNTQCANTSQWQSGTGN